MTRAGTGNCARISEKVGLASLDQAKLNIDARSRTSRLAWRGQFSPQLIDYLIDRICPDSRQIYDPFCGSGTVLFEAVEKGRTAFGLEVNPAAWHLASLASLATLPTAQRNAIISKVREVAARFSHTGGLDLFAEEVDQSAFLHEITNPLTDPHLRMALAAVLLSGMGDGKQLTATAISRGAFTIASVLGDLTQTSAKSACVLCDARRPPLPDESVDAVITSPPYINVFNYHQNYRPATELLGWKPLEAAQSEIGANRKHRMNRFLTVIQYCIDMTQTLFATAKVMRIGAPIVIIVGRTSSVLGGSFLNGALIRSLLESSWAFGPVKQAERVFINRFGERIYEDLLISQKVAFPRLDIEGARELGKLALKRAESDVPLKNRAVLDRALHQAVAVKPSPLLAMSIPSTFSSGYGSC